jgi:hypothetical protein
VFWNKCHGLCPWVSTVKLPADRARLPGHAVASRMRAKEISFVLCRSTRLSRFDGTGHVPVKKERGDGREFLSDLIRKETLI